MRITQSRYLAVYSPVPGIKVARFAQADLRSPLDTPGGIEECDLFSELKELVLPEIAPGNGLVVDLGRVEWFTSAFLHLLLHLRHCVRDRHGWLVLCNLRPHHQVVLDLTQTRLLFQIARDEEDALRQDKHP